MVTAPVDLTNKIKEFIRPGFPSITINDFINDPAAFTFVKFSGEKSIFSKPTMDHETIITFCIALEFFPGTFAVKYFRNNYRQP